MSELSDTSFILPIYGDSISGRRVVNRLSYLLKSLSPLGVEAVVSDASSSASPSIQDITRENGAIYAKVPRQSLFSPGLARDIGVQFSTRKNLFLLDVDLVFPPTFPALLEEQKSRLNHTHHGFIMAPCLYLTRNATKSVEANNIEIDAIWHRYLRGDFTQVINLAVASSAILIRRDHYLIMGGHRPEFAGHGCEDLDLIFRLTHEWPMGKTEPDVYVDVRQDSIAGSRGFRKHFAYYGLPAALNGLILAHRWHARPMLSRYFRNRPNNDLLFQDFMRAHIMHGDAPPALADLNVPEQTAVIAGPGITDVQAFRQFLPGLGRYEVINESDRLQAAGFSQFLFIGNSPPGCDHWPATLPASVHRVGTLLRQGDDSPTWRLEFSDLSGKTVREELYTGIQRYYADRKSYRWLFHRAVDCLANAELYEFEPPDYGSLPPLPPLDEYIRGLMRQSRRDLSACPGMFMNQWSQMSSFDRFSRKLRKLIRDPQAFWRDSRQKRRRQD
ncbi:MAG: hypothetical protein HQK55_00970 [Deltaproteobacteria bacterium]|nr:hypothetical protein [Deltaproteobacteria bacterium]